MSAKIEMIGKKYGKLLVVRQVEPSKSGHTRYLCKCDCGVEKIFQAQNIRTGKSESCGCERAKQLSERNSITKRTHCMSKSAEYKIWSGMLIRCATDHPKYHRHHGRGIKVCQRWRRFENFIADMGPRPSRFHSIDRIDNDGNYEPGNCRWATAKEQSANTINNIYETIDGEKHCLAEIARKYKINEQTLYHRYKVGKRGYDLIKKVSKL